MLFSGKCGRILRTKRGFVMKFRSKEELDSFLSTLKFIGEGADDTWFYHREIMAVCKKC